MTKWFLLALVITSTLSCLTFGEHYEKIPPGTWRGVLVLSDKADDFDEKSNGELPFNFEVVYDSPDSFHLVIHNGEERIVVRDIFMGVDRRTARDTIRIEFPMYDSYITAQYEEDAIEGFWVVKSKTDYQIQFKALHSQVYRFFQLPEAPVADLSGKWVCNFGIESEEPDQMLGEFKQDGNYLSGTFLSGTGDHRFLEGTVQGDRLFLSTFDGSHAFLYEAKIMPDGTLTGIFRSGNHFKTYWEASRNDTLQLEDFGHPMELTQVLDEKPFALEFTDPYGKVINIDQGDYAGKPKIIQIMGTWCPNCKDETTFLTEYLYANPDPGFEILGLSFERYADTLKANQTVRTYIEKMNIPYPVVFAGSSNKDEAGKTLPMLNQVVAYPTMIFLNKENQVVAIHTGFSGPATSAYEGFKNEFAALVAKMKSDL